VFRITILVITIGLCRICYISFGFEVQIGYQIQTEQMFA